MKKWTGGREVGYLKERMVEMENVRKCGRCGGAAKVWWVRSRNHVGWWLVVLLLGLLIRRVSSSRVCLVILLVLVANLMY